jgi:hypothetical protein
LNDPGCGEGRGGYDPSSERRKAAETISPGRRSEMNHPHLGRAMTMAAVLALTFFAGAAQAATRVAVFDFELLDTSTEADIRGPKPEEAKRLAMITAEMRNKLTAAGYEVVDLSPQKAQIEKDAPFRNCNGCDLDIARALNADIEVVGLVQKVSNLILNINFQLRDVADGKVLRAASADIRNNTDESWMRGISYLLRNRLFDPPLTGKAAP